MPIEDIENSPAPLDVRSMGNGSLPNVGLHCRGGIYYQESSQSLLWGAGVLLILAVMIAGLPWKTTTAFADIPLKYFIALAFICGAACCAIGSALRNVFGQTIVIDPQHRTLLIKSTTLEQTVSWDEIIAIDLVKHRPAGNPDMAGYVLVLRRKDQSHQIRSHILAAHVIKSHIRSLGRRYTAILGLPVIER